MPTLLMRFQGPMQSWGISSRFDERDTQLEPSKSGTIGLVCAALGRDRSESIDDLAKLRFGVRVDREGFLMRDFQTATGIMLATGKVDETRTVVSPRFFLSDAVFLVGLSGENRELLEMIEKALYQPVWPLSLGRKSFVPSPNIYLDNALLEEDLVESLKIYPSLIDGAKKKQRRIVFESDIGSVRYDNPIGSFAKRQFGPRYQQTLFLEAEE